MLSVERLGVLLAPKDENHAKYNALRGFLFSTLKTIRLTKRRKQ